MVELPCKVGDHVRVGDQGFVHVVSIDENCVVLRVTTQRFDQVPRHDRPGDDALDFQHSE